MYLNYSELLNIDLQYEVSRTVEANILLLIGASVITLQKNNWVFLFLII